MTLTKTDVAEMLRLLREDPDLQAELRQMVWSAELSALRQTVRDLVEAQGRSEERVARVESVLERLAEAQARTEERVQELAEAQARTEERVGRLEAAVERLAEAQARTEERVGRLEAAVERLAEAQARTEERVEELAEAHQRMAIAFTNFQNAFGATVEEEAESALQYLLQDRGYHLVSKPSSLSFDGEVDVVMEFEDPAGERVWAVIEAKARLGYREVQKWAQRMHSRGWHQHLAAEGVPAPYLVYAYGIRTDRGAEEAAKVHGIGLLTGRGEEVAPKGLIHEPTG